MRCSGDDGDLPPACMLLGLLCCWLGLRLPAFDMWSSLPSEPAFAPATVLALGLELGEPGCECQPFMVAVPPVAVLLVGMHMGADCWCW